MEIRNMTPHAVTVLDNNNKTIEVIAPSGMTIRLAQETEVVGSLAGIPLTQTKYGAPLVVSEERTSALPAVEEGVYYLVSAMIKNALPERTDFLVPAEQVRDEAGRVIGCRSLGV